MTKDDLLEIKKEIFELYIPATALCKKYGYDDILSFLADLRKNKVIRDAYPIEVQYIIDNHTKVPRKELMNRLQMPHTQYVQILKRYIGSEKGITRDNITLEEAINMTKWLIEECLQWKIDDFLPRTINSTYFVENNLFCCVNFAQRSKKDDPYFKHFSAVTFLIMKAYPNIYRGFQFRSSKTDRYFIDKPKSALIDAGRWVLEYKLGIKPEMVKSLALHSKLLTSRTLAFYGIASYKNGWKAHYNTIGEYIHDIIKSYYNVDLERQSLFLAKDKMMKEGLNVDSCEICGSSENIQIHHIWQKHAKAMLRYDINDIRNLIPLCGNHHNDKAHKFDYIPYKSKRKFNQMKNDFIEYMKS